MAEQENDSRDENDQCLQNHIVSTYQSLRVGLAVIAFAMPPILWVGGWWSHHLPLQSSMSAYYHASLTCCGCPGPANEGVMRDWFVGFLFAIGIMLCFYRGVTVMEQWALRSAGALACGVALIPMGWPPAHFPSKEFHSYPHSIVSILLFVCMGYLSIARSRDTLQMIRTQKRRNGYLLAYKVIGWAMIGSPISAVIAHSLLDYSGDNRTFTFFLEAAGTYAFASYWAVKTKELAESAADMKFARGTATIATHSWKDLFKPVDILRVRPDGSTVPFSSLPDGDLK